MMPCHTRFCHQALGYIGIYINEERWERSEATHVDDRNKEFLYLDVPRFINNSDERYYVGRSINNIHSQYDCGRLISDRRFSENNFLESVSPPKKCWRLTIAKKELPKSRYDWKYGRASKLFGNAFDRYIFRDRSGQIIPTYEAEKKEDILRETLVEGQWYDKYYKIPSAASAREISVNPVILGVAIVSLVAASLFAFHKLTA